MASPDSATTGAASPLTLGDREFRMSQLNDRDISELDEWVQDRIVAVAERSIMRQKLTPSEVERRLAIAYSAAAGATWMSGDGARMIATVDGIARLLWQSIHHNHPDVSYEDLRRLVYEERNSIPRIKAKFKHANGLEVEKKGSEPSELESPTTKAPSTDD